MNQNNIYRTIIIVASFLVYKYSKYAYAYLIFGTEPWASWPIAIPSTIMLLTGVFMAFLANYILNRNFSLNSFGLAPDKFFTGLMAATIFSLPMFLCLGIAYNFNFQPTLEILYKGFVLAVFGEEFIYRAFLFGLLFYYAGLGFLSA